MDFSKIQKKQLKFMHARVKAKIQDIHCISAAKGLLEIHAVIMYKRESLCYIVELK